MVCRRGHVTELEGHESELKVVAEIGRCEKPIQVGTLFQPCGATMTWTRRRPPIPRRGETA